MTSQTQSVTFTTEFFQTDMKNSHSHMSTYWLVK